MMKAIIIDDEISCIKTLASDLARHCSQVQILQECKSAKEGLKAIQLLDPDLVFLDINMPWMSGLELLELLGEIKFEVIFTTAHDQYAVKAFKLSAIDYLLKPIDHKELIASVSKAEIKRMGVSKEQLEQLQENISPSTPLNKIGIPSREGIDFVPIREIIYCEASSNYTYVHLQDSSKLLSAKTLKEFEYLLENDGFCRIHQSYLINLNHLFKYYRGDGGYVIMSNQANLNVSRSKKHELLSRIKM